MLGHTDTFFRRIYVEEMDRVGKDLGVNILFSERDSNALQWLRTNPDLLKAYSNIGEDVSDKIQGIISDAFHDPSQMRASAISKRITEVSGFARHRAENIARTETGRVSAAARRISYSKEATPDKPFLFSHIGPADGRTTPTCVRIAKRTAGGVPYDEYVQIMAEESAKDFPEWTVDKEAPQAHYQCRHTFVRVQ